MDAVLVPSEMSYETVTQSWYRFLHSIGNPVDLSKTEIISQTQAFYQYAIVAKNVIGKTNFYFEIPPLDAAQRSLKRQLNLCSFYTKWQTFQRVLASLEIRKKQQNVSFIKTPSFQFMY